MLPSQTILIPLTERARAQSQGSADLEISFEASSGSTTDSNWNIDLLIVKTFWFMYLGLWTCVAKVDKLFRYPFGDNPDRSRGKIQLVVERHGAFQISDNTVVSSQINVSRTTFWTSQMLVSCNSHNLIWSFRAFDHIQSPRYPISIGP